MKLTIVGAGFFGCTLARLADDHGWDVTVFETADIPGGAAADDIVDGTPRSRYGAHIFHTNNKTVWEFARRFTEFTNYVHTVQAERDGIFYTFPINLKTMNEVLGITSLKQAEQYLGDRPPHDGSLEGWCISNIGVPLYETFIKDYTEAQWGVPCSELPSSIITRLPVRLNFDNRYFSTIWQGMPIGGYTKWCRKMLGDVKVRYGEKWESGQGPVVHTGRVDHYLGMNELPFRSMEFIEEMGPSQGCSVLNHLKPIDGVVRTVQPDMFYPHDLSRKHIMKTDGKDVLLIKDKPCADGDPHYPINSRANSVIHKALLNEVRDGLYFGGRVGGYKYLDIDQTMAAAFSMWKKLYANYK